MRTMPCPDGTGKYSCSSRRLSGAHRDGWSRSRRRSSSGDLQQEHARAAAALLGFEQRRPAMHPAVQRGLDVIEREGARMRNLELREKRGLRGLAELEQERARSIQHAGAAEFERAHEGERERDGARIAPHVCAGACLIEVQGRGRHGFGIERRVLEVECGITDPAAIERAPQRLLPLGVLEEDYEVVPHGPTVSAARAAARVACGDGGGGTESIYWGEPGGG